MIVEKNLQDMNNKELVEVYFRMICKNFMDALKKEFISKEDEIIELIDRDEPSSAKIESFKKLTDSLILPIHAELEEKMFSVLPSLTNDLREVATEIYDDTMCEVAEELPEQLLELIYSRRL